MGYILDGIMGAVVGDALGVPAEFKSREELKIFPITDMVGYGTHTQPAGTWSDDSSMILATMDSLSSGVVDYWDIMNKFSDWCLYGAYSAYGEVFDIGITVRKAILNYGHDIEPVKCGGSGERDNGNGSLMRILPAAFYTYAHRNKLWKDNSALELIHTISALTHAHVRSKIGCGIYSQIIKTILEYKRENAFHSAEWLDYLQKKINHLFECYKNGFPSEYREEIGLYGKLKDLKKFSALQEEKITSSGYVVNTLEAAVWCMMNTNTYKECVLKAVNLGDDTDTVACVAGGMAGVFYGYENIPEKWKEQLAKRMWIEELCAKFQNTLDQAEKMSIDA